MTKALKLTKKQKKFCIEYAKTGNATQSAIKAGYKEKTAREMGCENLTKPNILAYIEKLMSSDIEKEKQDIADINEVLSFFSSVMRGDVKDQFGLDASLKDRLEAGKELHKRYEKLQNKSNDNPGRKVTIVNDLPR